MILRLLLLFTHSFASLSIPFTGAVPLKRDADLGTGKSNRLCQAS